MNTQCATQTAFSFRHYRKICLDFHGGQITSDAGLIALREFEHRIGFTDEIAACVHDARDSSYVQHGLQQLLIQRLYVRRAMGSAPYWRRSDLLRHSAETHLYSAISLSGPWGALQRDG